MKKVLFFCLFLIGVTNITAQENQSPKRLDFTASIQNNHLWRGLIITDKPVIMGNLSYALDKNQYWKVGIWGASAFSNDAEGTSYKEINYYIQYSKDRFYIGLWDLYNSTSINTLVASDDVFNYSKKRTSHIIDLRVNYTLSEKFPLNLEADILLYGGANAGEVILNEDGSYDKNAYSTYIQASYPVIKDQKVNLDAFLGAGFAFNGKDFLYGNGENDFDIVNIGLKASKTIKITENYSVPVSMMTMWNPSNKYARVQIAATIF